MTARFFRKTAVWAAITLLILTASSGCGHRRVSERTAPPKPPAAQPAATEQELNWWYVKFRFRWPADSRPEWHMDMLLAHRVIEPILAAHREEITLWRFHRRAVRDGAGHQFSFIFYADPQTAGAVQASVRKDSVVTDLLASRRLTAVITDPIDSSGRSRIEDTSDPVWPEALQKSWPFFIMGVSQTWLALIDRFSPAEREAPPDTEAMLAEYETIRRSIDRLWKDNGTHAFLHHLNALFGYQPFLIKF